MMSVLYMFIVVLHGSMVDGAAGVQVEDAEEEGDLGYMYIITIMTYSNNNNSNHTNSYVRVYTYIYIYIYNVL